jgi:uncharacterized protein YbcI
MEQTAPARGVDRPACRGSLPFGKAQEPSRFGAGPIEYQRRTDEVSRASLYSGMDEAQESPAGEEAPLRGGHLLSAISNRIVQIQREHYGRGPMKAKTYALDDLIVVVMRGSGFTPLEKTMMDSGDPERVVEMRHDFQHMMTKLFTDTIEELTGRKVLAFLSQAHVEPDLSLEMFFVDRPLEGFGAVELVQPE